jgi:hypothetical protein
MWSRQSLFTNGGRAALLGGFTLLDVVAHEPA